MSKNPLVRSVSRLLTLAVMLGALALLVSTQKAHAFDDPDTCNTQWGYCLYLCAQLTTTDYEACQVNCELNLMECEANDPYETLPAPYPVINNSFQSCLQACTVCSSIEDINDRMACTTPCWEWCNENYPRS